MTMMLPSFARIAFGQEAEVFVAVTDDDTTQQMRQLRNLIQPRVDAIICPTMSVSPSK